MVERIASLLKIGVPDVLKSGLLVASGDTVPTAGTNGYQTGCIFQHTDGGAGTALYINEGTSAACDFQAVAALTAAQEALLLTTAQQSLLVALTATAAELNTLDMSAKTETVAEAAKATGITAGSRYVKITGGTGFTGLVLPLPTAAEVGMIKQITLDTLTSGSVAITITNIAVGGSAATTATFDAAGESLILIGKVFGTTYRWSVLAEDGVTLS
jgi:hypothetical protein